MCHLGSGAAVSESGYRDALCLLCQDAGADLQRVLAGACEPVLARAARVRRVPSRGRRGRAMSLPAGMQWDLLPPLSARTADALIAGALEPAYDIAGDAFDYALNGTDLHLAIFDGLGHGLGSTLQ